MATVDGTSGNDFIHRDGDGLVAPPGYTEAFSSLGDDVINSGGGGIDIIHAGGGNDTINFADDLTADDIIDGYAGNDTLVINAQTDITFGAGSLLSVEKILLPFILLQPGFAGFQNLTMNDGNVAPGQILSVDASGLSKDMFFTFNGSAETDGFFQVTGGHGDDNITGGALGDSLDLSQGGTDTVDGGNGSNNFFFGDTLTADDTVIGGSDPRNWLFIGGPSYAAGLTFSATTIRNITKIVPSSGFSYKLTTNDANVGAHQLLTVDGSQLGVGDSLTFDGSAETDGRFSFIGGLGTNKLKGGHGDDTFSFIAASLTKSDVAAGGGGDDTLIFTTAGKIAALAFNHVSGIESITLADGKNHIFLPDALVASAHGQELAITGGSGNDTIDGTSVTTAANRLFFHGGGGADTLIAGAGADHFIYSGVADSAGLHFDTVEGFNFANDRFDVPGAITAVDAAVTTGALSSATFKTDLAAALDSAHLGAHHAVLFTPNAGTLSGETFLIIDLNGHAGYHASDDLVIHLAGQSGTLTTGDFV